MVMVLMTDKAMHDFTQANNFSLNGNAGLSIVSYSARGQAPAGKGDVVVWSNKSGAYAGLSVNGTDITSNNGEDHNYYGRRVSTLDIVQRKANNPSADPQRNALPS